MEIFFLKNEKIIRIKIRIKRQFIMHPKINNVIERQKNKYFYLPKYPEY